MEGLMLIVPRYRRYCNIYDGNTPCRHLSTMHPQHRRREKGSIQSNPIQSNPIQRIAIGLMTCFKFRTSILVIRIDSILFMSWSSFNFRVRVPRTGIDSSPVISPVVRTTMRPFPITQAPSTKPSNHPIVSYHLKPCILAAGQLGYFKDRA